MKFRSDFVTNSSSSSFILTHNSVKTGLVNCPEIAKLVSIDTSKPLSIKDAYSIMNAIIEVYKGVCDRIIKDFDITYEAVMNRVRNEVEAKYHNSEWSKVSKAEEIIQDKLFKGISRKDRYSLKFEKRVDKLEESFYNKYGISVYELYVLFQVYGAISPEYKFGLDDIDKYKVNPDRSKSIHVIDYSTIKEENDKDSVDKSEAYSFYVEAASWYGYSSNYDFDSDTRTVEDLICKNCKFGKKREECLETWKAEHPEEYMRECCWGDNQPDDTLATRFHKPECIGEIGVHSNDGEESFPFVDIFAKFCEYSCDHMG